MNHDGTEWMSNKDRPCRTPINDPHLIRQRADQFYPRETYYRAAKKLCDGCPVATACLQYALDNREEHGVWGGLDPNDRARLLKGAVA